MRTREVRVTWKSCSIMRSYTLLTEPAVEFSMGRTPYWQRPCSTARKTPSKLSR